MSAITSWVALAKKKERVEGSELVNPSVSPSNFKISSFVYQIAWFRSSFAFESYPFLLILFIKVSIM